MTAPVKAETRIKAHRRGHMAESVAAVFLMLKGYRILSRRYKTPVGEIDIIARRGNVVVFIEVKTRKAIDTALESVTVKMKRRIERAAEYYLSVHSQQMNKEMRFDVIAISLPFFIRHLDNAWRPGA